MKKTLVALAVAAFATSSASALTIYEQDGSKVQFDGSLRLRLDKESTKENDATTKRAHSNLHNNGSRFGVRFNHNIAEDFYALGRLEFRFNGGDKAKSTDQFGDLYAYRAYVGLGSKQYGELTFGRQATIGSDIEQSGFEQAYGTFDGTLTGVGKAVVRYDYKGIEGLQVGVDYRFAEDRVNDGSEKEAKDAVSNAELALLKAKFNNAPVKDVEKAEKALAEANDKLAAIPAKGEVAVGKLKSGYGAGAVYTFKAAEGQDVTLAAGYTRDNFVTGTNKKHHKDAYQAGVSYKVDALTLAADYAGAFAKNGSKKDRFNGFRVGAKYQVTPEVAVYTNYGRGVAKTKESNVTTKKVNADRFMLGTSYQVHKNVFTYVEGGFGTVKTTESKGVKKERNRNIAVGLNVSW